MVYAENLSQPSILNLARSGDFRAINYLINSYLRPQGLYARVAPEGRGRLQVLVEFQTAPVAERLTKLICHLLWKINSPSVEGVQILGRYTGDQAVLWKQSVRLVTPANRVRRRSGSRTIDGLKFRTFRTLMMMGSTVAAFILGCWVSYYDVMVQLSQSSAPAQHNAVASPFPPKRSEQVQAALEVVPVIQHTAVQNPQDPTVTLMFGGDVTLSDHFETVVGDRYDWAFEKLDEYREADVAMVNLENPLTRSTLRRPNKQFNFKADPEAVQVLTSGGIDIVNLANNHTMDYEAEGLIETLETLEKAGIRSVGAGRNITEARRPEILEVKGQRIAYFGYYDADFHAADENTPGTNPRHDQRVVEDIQAVRDQVDWIVVNYHWGVELAQYPGDWQIDLARLTIDSGADVVVGHHPHVLQGAEIYKGRPIVYSLGNFIFGGNSRTDYDTAVLKVSLKADRKMKVEFLPVEVRQYQAQIVKGKKGNEILQQVERLSRIFKQPMDSPVILEAQREGSRNAQRGTPAPQLPRLSDPTLPANPPKKVEYSVGEDVETQPESVNLPPRLAPSTADPFQPYIHDPFIKEPFISTPPETPPSTSHHPVEDAQQPISFALLPSRWETVSLEQQPPTTSLKSHKAGVDLPPVVQRVQT